MSSMFSLSNIICLITIIVTNFQAFSKKRMHNFHLYKKTDAEQEKGTIVMKNRILFELIHSRQVTYNFRHDDKSIFRYTEIRQSYILCLANDGSTCQRGILIMIYCLSLSKNMKGVMRKMLISPYILHIITS